MGHFLDIFLKFFFSLGRLPSPEFGGWGLRIILWKGAIRISPWDGALGQKVDRSGRGVNCKCTKNRKKQLPAVPEAASKFWYSGAQE